MSLRLRALIVDDEHLARKRLAEMLHDTHVNDIEIIGEADSVPKAAMLSSTLQPDVLFLDIQMPPDTGFSLLPHLAEIPSKPSVVFVTAFDDYAVRAFEANALDYLLKPVRAERLATTIKRLQFSRANGGSAPPPSMEVEGDDKIGATEPNYQPNDIIVLKDAGTLTMTKAVDILAIQAEGAYCHVYIANRKTVMIKQSISSWEDSLPTCTFVRISRSLMLNKASVHLLKTVTRDTVEIHLQGLPEPILASRLECTRLRASLG